MIWDFVRTFAMSVSFVPACSKRAMLRGPLFQAQDSRDKDRSTEQKTAENTVRSAWTRVTTNALDDVLTCIDHARSVPLALRLACPFCVRSPFCLRGASDSRYARTQHA